MADEIETAQTANQNLPEGAEPAQEPTGNTAETTETPAPASQLSEDEVADAKKDGLKEAIKDSAKIAPDVDLLANSEANQFKYHGFDEIQQYAFWLDRSVDDIKAAYEAGGIPEAKLYGLLALERNGQNRTPYVKYMKDTLGLDAGELPGGGPDYTNDVSSVSDL